MTRATAAEPLYVGQSPAGLPFDFACESLQKRLPLLDMTAHDVPGAGKQATLPAPLLGKARPSRLRMTAPTVQTSPAPGLGTSTSLLTVNDLL